MQKKDSRYGNSESPEIDQPILFQKLVTYPITNAQKIIIDRLIEMDLEAQEKGTNPDPYVGYGHEVMAHIARCLVALSLERSGLDEASVIAAAIWIRSVWGALDERYGEES